MRARLVDTNINEKALLATDYLNHFHEFVMLLELVRDHPLEVTQNPAFRLQQAALLDAAGGIKKKRKATGPPLTISEL